MDIRKVIQRRIRHRGDGLDVAADVNAVIAANVDEKRNVSHVSSRQRVVHRSGGQRSDHGRDNTTGGGGAREPAGEGPADAA